MLLSRDTRCAPPSTHGIICRYRQCTSYRRWKWNWTWSTTQNSWRYMVHVSWLQDTRVQGLNPLLNILLHGDVCDGKPTTLKCLTTKIGICYFEFYWWGRRVCQKSPKKCYLEMKDVWFLLCVCVKISSGVRHIVWRWSNYPRVLCRHLSCQTSFLYVSSSRSPNQNFRWSPNQNFRWIPNQNLRTCLVGSSDWCILRYLSQTYFWSECSRPCFRSPCYCRSRSCLHSCPFWQLYSLVSRRWRRRLIVLFVLVSLNVQCRPSPHRKREKKKRSEKKNSENARGIKVARQEAARHIWTYRT